jgi:hypothetical protein
LPVGLLCRTHAAKIVIASEAKQSIVPQEEEWIASAFAQELREVAERQRLNPSGSPRLPPQKASPHGPTISFTGCVIASFLFALPAHCLKLHDLDQGGHSTAEETGALGQAF